MVKKAYTEAMKGLPDFEADQKIKTRKEELVQEALLIIEAIKQFGKGSKDPLVDPEVIWAAIKTGILDAPGLMKMSVARGSVKTGIVNGANRALDDEGQPITEKKRLERLGFRL